MQKLKIFYLFRILHHCASVLLPERLIKFFNWKIWHTAVQLLLQSIFIQFSLMSQGNLVDLTSASIAMKINSTLNEDWRDWLVNTRRPRFKSPSLNTGDCAQFTHSRKILGSSPSLEKCSLNSVIHQGLKFSKVNFSLDLMMDASKSYLLTPITRTIVFPLGD